MKLFKRIFIVFVFALALIPVSNLHILAEKNPSSITETDSCGFYNLFNDTATGWSSVYGTWWLSPAAGVYYTSGAPTAPFPYQFSYASAKQDGTYDDFDYSARIRRFYCDSCPNGVIVRGTPFPLVPNGTGRWNSGYEFTITRQGGFWVIRLDPDGTWQFLQEATHSDAINTGSEWNTVRVVASGPVMFFYINGELVWSGVDSTYTSGNVGLLMHRTAFYDSENFQADWALLTCGAPDLTIINLPLVMK